MAEAARILCDGGLVAFPTETVYGLAVDSSNPMAVERLDQAKGRPPEKPYSLHLGDPSQLHQFVDRVPPAASRLIARYWPGPLTIVMPGKQGRMLGFRLPNHPVARELLRRCPCPVVAPSANPSGMPPPTDAQEVLQTMNGLCDCVLDAGPTPLGRESTVVRVIDDRVEVLRQGAIAADELLAVALS